MYIGQLTAQSMYIGQLTAESMYIGQLTAESMYIGQLTAQSMYIGQLFLCFFVDNILSQVQFFFEQLYFTKLLKFTDITLGKPIFYALIVKKTALEKQHWARDLLNLKVANYGMTYNHLLEFIAGNTLSKENSNFIY